MLEELTVIVDVSLRWVDVAERLDDQLPLSHTFVRNDAPHHPGGDHQIVAGAIRQDPELAFEHTGAVMDEDAVITMGEAIPVGHGLRRPDHRQDDLVVAHDRHPAGHGITTFGNRSRAKVTWPQMTAIFEFQRRIAKHLDLPQLSRRPQVVENRLDAGKAVNAHQLFVVERAVRLAELDVPFVGQLSQFVVVGHGRSSPFLEVAATGLLTLDRLK